MTAYDPMIQAHAGVAAAQGKGDQPAFMRTLLCDKITGYTACQAVTSALFMRERTGEGQHLDLSMIDSGLFFIFLDGFQNDTLLSEDHERGPMLIDILYERDYLVGQLRYSEALPYGHRHAASIGRPPVRHLRKPDAQYPRVKGDSCAALRVTDLR